jgi:hypothetical protein
MQRSFGPRGGVYGYCWLLPLDGGLVGKLEGGGIEGYEAKTIHLNVSFRR